MTRLIGRIIPGPTLTTIVGEIKCEVFGSTWIITGTINADGSYTFQALPGPIPEGLKLPWEDN
jgi:hypothetical protein